MPELERAKKMQVDFFEIENKPEAQKMVMPWPMKIVGFNLRGGMVRVYYVEMPGATEQQGTFYCVSTEQVLPETFPAKLLGTIFPYGAQILDPDEGDTAVHIFFETPVNKPRKPRAVAKQKSGGGKNGDS